MAGAEGSAGGGENTYNETLEKVRRIRLTAQAARLAVEAERVKEANPEDAEIRLREFRKAWLQDAEVEAPAGYHFRASWVNERDGSVVEMPIYKWDPNLLAPTTYPNHETLDTERVPEQVFIAGRIIANLNTMTVWMVSPDGELCSPYTEYHLVNLYPDQPPGSDGGSDGGGGGGPDSGDREPLVPVGPLGTLAAEADLPA